MWGLDFNLLLVQAVDAADDQAGGEQGALDRIGRFAGKEHLFDIVDQRAKEVGERGTGRRHG